MKAHHAPTATPFSDVTPRRSRRLASNGPSPSTVAVDAATPDDEHKLSAKENLATEPNAAVVLTVVERLPEEVDLDEEGEEEEEEEEDMCESLLADSISIPRAEDGVKQLQTSSRPVRHAAKAWDSDMVWGHEALRNGGGCSSSSSSQDKTNGKNEPATFKCRTCNEVFMERAALKRHSRRQHRNDRPWPTKSAFGTTREHRANGSHGDAAVVTLSKERMRTFAKEMKEASKAADKFVWCALCRKNISKFYLNTHLRLHTGQRPYRCDFCGSCYTDDTNRNKHERNHVKGRPFACDECDEHFITPRSLKFHLRKVHNRTKDVPSTDEILAQVANQHGVIRAMNGNGRQASMDDAETPPSPPAQRKRSSPIHTTDDSGACSSDSEAAYACTDCPENQRRTYASRSSLYQHYKRCHSGIRPNPLKLSNKPIKKETVSYETSVKRRRYDSSPQILRVKSEKEEEVFEEATLADIENVFGSMEELQREDWPPPHTTALVTARCSLCGSGFAEDSKLRAHIENVHGLNPDQASSSNGFCPPSYMDAQNVIYTIQQQQQMSDVSPSARLAPPTPATPDDEYASFLMGGQQRSNSPIATSLDMDLKLPSFDQFLKPVPDEDKSAPRLPSYSESLDVSAPPSTTHPAIVSVLKAPTYHTLKSPKAKSLLSPARPALSPVHSLPPSPLTVSPAARIVSPARCSTTSCSPRARLVLPTSSTPSAPATAANSNSRKPPDMSVPLTPIDEPGDVISNKALPSISALLPPLDQDSTPPTSPNNRKVDINQNHQMARKEGIVCRLRKALKGVGAKMGPVAELLKDGCLESWVDEQLNSSGDEMPNSPPPSPDGLNAFSTNELLDELMSRRSSSCICGLIFNDRTHLAIHRVLHDPHRPASCSTCNEHFATWCEFIEHLNSGSGCK